MRINLIRNDNVITIILKNAAITFGCLKNNRLAFCKSVYELHTANSAIVQVLLDDK